jgi:hypothetical protein
MKHFTRTNTAGLVIRKRNSSLAAVTGTEHHLPGLWNVSGVSLE